jgi:hypothetical protein
VVHRSGHDDAGHFSLYLNFDHAMGTWNSSHDDAKYVYSASNIDQAIGMWNNAAVTTMKDIVAIPPTSIRPLARGTPQPS